MVNRVKAPLSYDKGSFLLFVKSIKALSKKRDKTVAIPKLLSYFGSLSTVVGDEKLTSREDLIGLLFFGSLSTVVGDEKRLFVNCSGLKKS